MQEPEIPMAQACRLTGRSEDQLRTAMKALKARQITCDNLFDLAHYQVQDKPRRGRRRKGV